jgi:chromosome segregation ATPase
LFFNMARTLTLTLAGEDLSRLAADLARRGSWPLEAGLAWLLAEGARHYARDQHRWHRIQVEPATEDEAERLELQRREAVAHLLSMRARVLQTEWERDLLRAQVAALEEEYRALRDRLLSLQQKRRALREALQRRGVQP